MHDVGKKEGAESGDASVTTRGNDEIGGAESGDASVTTRGCDANGAESGDASVTTRDEIPLGPPTRLSSKELGKNVAFEGTRSKRCQKNVRFLAGKRVYRFQRVNSSCIF
ncbi:hypothetical protein ScPMuIL_013820 [Solemya velum]